MNLGKCLTSNISILIILYAAGNQKTLSNPDIPNPVCFKIKHKKYIWLKGCDNLINHDSEGSYCNLRDVTERKEAIEALEKKVINLLK
jgi:hypothetical protein